MKPTNVTQNDNMFRHRKRHVFGADLDRQEVVAEAALRRRREHEEHHDRAVHRHQRQVKLRSHHAAGRARRKQRLQNGPTRSRPGQVQSHEQRHRHADQHCRQRQHDVLDADDLVVDAEDVLTYEARRCRVPVHALVSLI